MRLAEAPVPTRHGKFEFVVFPGENVALVRGDVRGDGVLVRVHAECVRSDLFEATTCRCREHLDRSLAEVGAAERGVVVYLRRHPHEPWLDACEGHPREDVDAAAPILAELGVKSVSP